MNHKSMCYHVVKGVGPRGEVLGNPRGTILVGSTREDSGVLGVARVPTVAASISTNIKVPDSEDSYRIIYLNMVLVII